MKLLVGKGQLSWNRGERVSDRYGSVRLYDSHGGPVPLETELTRLKGRLVAKILEARRSTHIGDLFRGLFPSTPDVGEEILLGKGMVFYLDDGRAIGLEPEEPRDSDWLNPKALYRAHDQTVELYFEPTSERTDKEGINP